MKFLIEEFRRFAKEEAGIGIVEIILILVVLIGVVIVFKDEIEKVVEKAMKQITGDVNKIVK